MKQPKMGRDPRHLGFSLIEVLIVITVVALLIALLLPALGEARKMAQSANCKSKERQIHVAMTHYTLNNKGLFPYAAPYYTSSYGVQSTAGEIAWSWKVSPYLGDYARTSVPTALVCPSNPWPVINPGISRVMPPSTYGLADGAFPSTGTPTRGGPITTPMMKTLRLLAPSRVLMLGETPMGTAVANGFGRVFDEGLVVEPTPFRTDNVAYFSVAPVGYWYTPEIAGRPTPSPGHPTVRVNHNIGWNSGMADGSVIYHKKSQIQTWAQQATNLTASSEGMMFWNNAR